MHLCCVLPGRKACSCDMSGQPSLLPCPGCATTMPVAWLAWCMLDRPLYNTISRKEAGKAILPGKQHFGVCTLHGLCLRQPAWQEKPIASPERWQGRDLVLASSSYPSSMQWVAGRWRTDMGMCCCCCGMAGMVHLPACHAHTHTLHHSPSLHLPKLISCLPICVSLNFLSCLLSLHC